MAVHSCEACGLVHDAIVAEEREPVEVTLARIASEQAIQVARIQAGADRAAAAAAIEVAHEEARGEVEAAEAQAELLGDAIEASTADDEAPEPLEIIAPVTDVDITEEEDDAPPPAEGSPVPAPEKKTRGLGMW